MAQQLAALVADWPKYQSRYAADPETFVELEAFALVDYIAQLLETGDENFRHLYLGEKVKQFHDPSAPDEERRSREAILLAAERRIFVEAAEGAGARKTLNEAFDEIERVLTSDAPAKVRVLFVGDCLYLDVMSFLPALALADGVTIEPTYVTGHDAAEIRASIGKLIDERFDAVFFSPFTYASLTDYDILQRPRSMLRPRDVAGRIRSAVADALGLFEALAGLFDCPLFVHAPAPIIRHEGTMAERIRNAVTAPARRLATDRLRRDLFRSVEARAGTSPIVHIVDESELASARGLRHEGRYFYHSYHQHPAAFGATVAAHYRDIILAVARLLKRKVVVCDLDNTLWEGVIGEGLGVSHYASKQEVLLRLKKRGVVLAINSKNDPAKVVWEAAADSLCLEDFVSRQINWDPKPLNMRRISEHLNLKEKDFVFIDDRPDERAMVQEHAPAILALDATEPRTWDLLALWADLLPDDPNADRTDFYRQRDQREAFLGLGADENTLDRDEMYAELGLTFTVREAEAADLPRVTELINRTNQFNMGGSRVTRRQVEAWSEGASSRILIGDAADRFGGMGTVSVLVVERNERTAHIPVFVLSCRVFGYGMDMAMIEAARETAGDGAELVGAFAETPFNQPCREVYPAAGFAWTDGAWHRPPQAGAIQVPGWLAVERRLRPFMETARQDA